MKGIHTSAKEGAVAVTREHTLYKVNAVAGIYGIKKMSSQTERHHFQDHFGSSEQEHEFSEVLTKEKEKITSNEIQFQTMSYTRSALPLKTFYKLRSYN